MKTLLLLTIAVGIGFCTAFESDHDTDDHLKDNSSKNSDLIKGVTSDKNPVIAKNLNDEERFGIGAHLNFFGLHLGFDGGIGRRRRHRRRRSTDTDFGNTSHPNEESNDEKDVPVTSNNLASNACDETDYSCQVTNDNSSSNDQHAPDGQEDEPIDYDDGNSDQQTHNGQEDEPIDYETGN